VRPILIAHRTCPRDAPENSLAGIAIAAALGADAVEVDVRRTRDGVAVLLHDERLLRTAGRIDRIDRVQSDVARRLRLRGSAERLPTFAEALDALGPTMRIAIDVKDPGAGDVVISEIRNQQRQAQSLFWSQHDTAIRTAVEQAPELEISLLRDTRTAAETQRFLDDAVQLGVRGVSAHWSQVGTDLAARCDQLGLVLYAWCKARPIDAHKLALLDGLVTDWPRQARAAIGELGAG
jgi:glycerophosphoryl diester phosphodiesterase